jgi:hypothetical protein
MTTAAATLLFLLIIAALVAAVVADVVLLLGATAGLSTALAALRANTALGDGHAPSMVVRGLGPPGWPFL